MIKNLVLDMGNVLIRFDREEIMNEKGITAPADRAILMKELFITLEWAQLDRGSLTEEEACRIICERVPEHLHKAVREILFGWFRPLTVIDGMDAYIRECKQLGLKIYMLSNTSTSERQYDHLLPASELFDGKVLSADLKLVKPQAEIYDYFCRHFDVKPEECLFIDDNCVNIEGCVYCGWKGIVFHGDMKELRRKTRDMGVMVSL